MDADEYDVVLLDLNLSDSVGFEGLDRCRVAAPKVPVIIVTGFYEPALVDIAVKKGAQDILSKEEVTPELLQRTIQSARSRKFMENELELLALFDPLTGLGNRRYLTDQFDKQYRLPSNENKPFALFYADMDGLKELNDSYGHAAGDKLLIEIARRLNKILPHDSIVTRVGGDEFCAIVPLVSAEQDFETEYSAACRLLEEPTSEIHGKPYSPSISIGYVKSDYQKKVPLDELIKQADQLMFEDKRQSKLARSA